MKLMVSELYEALVDSGASEDKAKAAAESVADFQESMHRLDKKMDRLTWISGLILMVLVLPQLKVLFA